MEDKWPRQEQMRCSGVQERLLLGRVVIREASHTICCVRDKRPETRKDGINTEKRLGCVSLTVALIALGRIEMRSRQTRQIR